MATIATSSNTWSSAKANQNTQLEEDRVVGSVSPFPPSKNCCCCVNREWRLPSCLDSKASACGYHGDAAFLAAKKIRDNKFSSPRTGVEKQGAVNRRGRGVSSPHEPCVGGNTSHEGKELGASIWGKECDSGLLRVVLINSTAYSNPSPTRDMRLIFCFLTRAKGLKERGIVDKALDKSCQCRLPKV